MVRATRILQMGRQSLLQDANLLKALQSEINHEASANRFKNDKTEPLGDFMVDWDSPQSKDVVLRKKFESGEEIAVSALLGGESDEYDTRFPREVLMKVCMKKPGLSSILQFDCGVYRTGEHGIEFDIHDAKYLQSATTLGSSAYRGPLFSTLDPVLQFKLKLYLEKKGIGENLSNFLIIHLHKKEQGQYEDWLNKLKDIIGKKE